MANREQEEILKQGVDKWNQWRKENPRIPLDLSGADLRGVNLREADLRGANLMGVNLREADLRGANLMGALPHKADLREARLIKVNLINAQLLRADLRKTDLSGADLSQANLIMAHLNKANLTESLLVKAILTGANFSQANLNGANLSQAILNGANLSQAILSEANFSQAILSQAILTGACIKNCNFTAQTNLEDIVCKYIYYSGQSEENAGSRFSNRRPHDPSKTFTPGDFSYLVQKGLETVDLIFSKGIDWEAFLISLDKVQVESNNEPLSVQAIEHKDDGAFVVRVRAPYWIDKAEIQRSFEEKYNSELKVIEAKYQGELKTKDSQIETYQQHNADLMEIIKWQTKKPINNIAMSESRSNSNQNNVNQPIANTGRIDNPIASGNNTNINQVQDPQLKELLEQLKSAINCSDLGEEDKEDALEEVAAIVEAEEKQDGNLLQKADRRLKRIISGTEQATQGIEKIENLWNRIQQLEVISSILENIPQS